MRLIRYLIRLAAAAALLAGTAAFVAAASPAAYAAPETAQQGWVRIAHLSPDAPAMDIYLYSFSNPGHPTVLKDVSYGDVSRYMALSPGQYTVAMRGFGAPPSSHPALTSSFMVSTHTAYTVAALGPDPGLKVDVLQDRLTAPTGKALVRVVQASLKQNRVTVSYGSDVLAKQLGFSTATRYVAVSPGKQIVRLTTPGAGTDMSVSATADTVHTIVVLDGSSGLLVDDLTDAAGSKIMPKGGAGMGFGGTAPRPPASPAPWVLMFAAGVLLIAGGFELLRRSRRAIATAQP
jgi:Domain of unknown function (DUF4397)